MRDQNAIKHRATRAHVNTTRSWQRVLFRRLARRRLVAGSSRACRGVIQNVMQHLATSTTTIPLMHIVRAHVIVLRGVGWRSIAKPLRRDDNT